MVNANRPLVEGRMNIKQMKEWIDEASYEDLLKKWRFAPTGSAYFARDTGMGDYYESVMNKKKTEMGDEAAARISKIIGWKK